MVVLLILLCSVTVALVGGYAQGAGPVLADLHHRDINDNFGTRLVQVVDQLFGQRDLIGSARTTRAFCESNCCTRCTSNTERIAFTNPAVRWAGKYSKDKKF